MSTICSGQTGFLTAETLAALPPELLTRFETVINRADVDMVESIIGEIRPSNAGLADKLMELATMFEYNVIADLIQEARQEIEREIKK